MHHLELVERKEKKTAMVEEAKLLAQHEARRKKKLPQRNAMQSLQNRKTKQTEALEQSATHHAQSSAAT